MCANTTIEELSLNGNKFGSYKDVENSRYRREGLANIARSRSLRSLSLSSKKNHILFVISINKYNYYRLWNQF